MSLASMQTLSRPSRQSSPSESPSSSPGLPSAEPARLRHLLRATEELRDVDAHQRRRHHAERRERRVAPADRRLAREHRGEAALARELLERRAGVGDRAELIAVSTRPFPEVVGVRARLERRARLRRGDEQRTRDVELRLEIADRLRMRRVEDVERLLPKRAREHLGRERRAAHAEQHDRVEAVDDRVGELQQQVDVLPHAPRLVEPAEPLPLVRPPSRRVASRAQMRSVISDGVGVMPPPGRRAWRGCSRRSRRTSRRTSARPPPRAS